MFQVDFNDMLQDPEFSPRARGCSRLNCVQSKLSTVFPACAGMFLAETQLRGLRRGFPRVRGDVPLNSLLRNPTSQFSPRARGCSHGLPNRQKLHSVFPACAGMFLRRMCSAGTVTGFPRVRGDVPWCHMLGQSIGGFSPRARGCSSSRVFFSRARRVFPACAGMFRDCGHEIFHHASFPRVRGDVPPRLVQRFKRFRFSPRARGCSAAPCPTLQALSVFPACAGMFRPGGENQPPRCGFPRVRGDVPIRHGCLVVDIVVFPACAGMFLRVLKCFRALGCFPRVRGDVPFDNGFETRLLMVFPACAGMFLIRRLQRSPSHQFSPRARGCSGVFPGR